MFGEGCLGSPGSSAGKESASRAGDLGSVPALGRFPGEGNGYPLQYSCLENPRDCSPVCGFTKTQTQLTRFPLRGLWIRLLTSWCSVLITPCKSVAFSALFCFPVIPDHDSFQPLLYTHWLTLSNTFLPVLKYLCNFKNLIFRESSLHAVVPQTPSCLLLLFSHSILHFLKCACLPSGTADLWLIARTSRVPRILPALFLSHEHLGISGLPPHSPPKHDDLVFDLSVPTQDSRVLGRTVDLTGAAACFPHRRGGLCPASAERWLLLATSSPAFPGSLQVVPIRGMGVERRLKTS